MNFLNKTLTGFFIFAVLLSGMTIFSTAKSANAQMMRGHTWEAANQQHNGAMRGGSIKTNTPAGFHNGHGPHAGPIQGCAW